MLTIRDEQMRILAEAQSGRFERALVEQVVQGLVVSLPDAEALVRAARAKATSYGLTSSRDVHRFVNLCAAEGLDFDHQPSTVWMRAALLDRSISSPSERLRVLTSALARRAAVAQHNANVQPPAAPALPPGLR